jgi:hypothetical protein
MSILTSGTQFDTRTTGVESRERITSIPVSRGRKPTDFLPIVRAPRSIPVPGITRSIEVKVASTESEWEQAFELAASNYQARGYETPGENRLRFTFYHALPDTVTFVAKHEGIVVATFSIVQDNELLGLPMEDAYADEIASLRREGRRLFEATTLADRGLNHREFLQVFLSLIRLSEQYHTRHGGDSYVIAVNPRHKKFYTKLIGFVPIGSLRTYAAVQDAPAEAFLLDNHLQKENSPETYEFMFGEPLPRECLIPVRIPRSLIRAFSRRSIHCDPDQIEHILAYTEQNGSTRRW